MVDCSICRRTLASYQEAGSRFRGAAPFLPLVAFAARVGTALRAGIESPIALGTAAAVGTLAVGGALVAHHPSASVSKARTSAFSRLQVEFHAPASAGGRSNASFVVEGTPAGAQLPVAQAHTPSPRRRPRVVFRAERTFEVPAAAARPPATTRATPPAPPFGAPAVVRTPEASPTDTRPGHVKPAKAAKPAHRASRSPAATTGARGKSAGHAKPKNNPVARSKSASAATNAGNQTSRGHASRNARLARPAPGPAPTGSNGHSNAGSHVESGTKGKASPRTLGNPSLDAAVPDASTAATARAQSSITSRPSEKARSEKAAPKGGASPNAVSSDTATTPVVPPAPAPGPAAVAPAPTPPVPAQDSAAVGDRQGQAPPPGRARGLLRGDLVTNAQLVVLPP